jgi:predicted nucleic acid-binding protein
MAKERWLLDTAVLIDLLRGEIRARNWIDSLAMEARAISVVTAAELLAGARNRREQKNIELEIELYEMLWLDEMICERALELYKRFRLSHNIGFLDCLIAATALEHDLTLATLNLKHFHSLPNLQVIRPY